MLPSQQVLEQIARKIKHIPNKRRESKREIHFGLFLLGYKSGLRVNEAVSFDLNNKTYKGLYHIEKTKRQKARLVYVSKEVIRELKKNNWKPNQTNRWNFYHFLRKIKRELNLPTNIELTPHTFRRAFATYHAETGLPLPLLQKLLGHSSIRTTALYWQNIYGEDDPSNILAGKKWLENREKELPEPPTENLEPDIISNKPVTSAEKPTNQDNSLLTAKTKKKPVITNYQPKALTNEISPKNQGEFSLTSGQLPLVTSKKEQPTEKERILLTKIKQLEEQIIQIQAENSNLKLENKHLKALIKQDQKTEAKVIQPLIFKPNK